MRFGEKALANPSRITADEPPTIVFFLPNLKNTIYEIVISLVSIYLFAMLFKIDLTLTHYIKYRASQKNVNAFGGLWNNKYVTDIQNKIVNLLFEG